MLQNIYLWIIEHIFKIKTQTTDIEVNNNSSYSAEYQRIDEINFTAIFANKIANYTANDSNMDVKGDNPRAKYFNEIAQSIRRKIKKISSMALGTGGIAIVPYIKGGKIFYNLVDQSRLLINEETGDLITSATMLADSKSINDILGKRVYMRWTNYKIENGSLVIEQKYTDENGNELENIPEFWQTIPQMIVISNVDRVPFGFVKCPRDNRKAKDSYGVPITYGCEDTIEEIRECLKQVAREYKIKESFIGVDYTMFKKDKYGSWELPHDGLYRKFNSDKDDFWEVFSPDIRDSSYYNRLQELYSRLEKQIGTSAGILTEIKTQDATATAIKRASYDTFTIVDDLRDNLEKALDDFFKACDVFANAYNIVPNGTYVLSFDWGCSLFEDTQETFNQYIQGISQGVVSKAELRQFIFSNESIEDSEKAVEKIESEVDDVDKLLEDQENEKNPKEKDKEKDKEKVKEEGKDNEENND